MYAPSVCQFIQSHSNNKCDLQAGHCQQIAAIIFVTLDELRTNGGFCFGRPKILAYVWSVCLIENDVFYIVFYRFVENLCLFEGLLAYLFIIRLFVCVFLFAAFCFFAKK